jgi:hypothetical protein
MAPKAPPGPTEGPSRGPETGAGDWSPAPFPSRPCRSCEEHLPSPPESPPFGQVGTAYEAGSLRWRRDRLAAHSRRSKTFAPRALRNRAGFSLLLGLRGEAPGAKTQAATGGRLAQLVERFVYTEDVGSSSLSSPTRPLLFLLISERAGGSASACGRRSFSFRAASGARASRGMGTSQHKIQFERVKRIKNILDLCMILEYTINKSKHHDESREN